MFFPSVNDRFISSKSPDEVCRLLQCVTESHHTAFTTGCEFIGKVDTVQFSIQPYQFLRRNSFLPVIKGDILPQGKGSEIVLQMRICLPAAVFMAFWFGVMIFVFLCGVAAGITGGFENMWQLTAVSGGMIAIGQILMRASFFYPTRKAQKRLRELLV